MIAKIPPKRKDGRSSFKELIDYIRGKNGERAVHVGFQEISSAELAAIEMEAVAHSNVRCKDPVFHFILSWRELEYPTNEQVDEAVKIALKELDLQNCQALWAFQTDTENQHVHVAVNRIDPETGRAIQPAGNWTHKALERAARKIETAQGWEVLKEGRYEVTPNGEVKERPSGQRSESERLSQTAQDIEAHTAAKSVERIGKEKALPVIQAAKSWEELHEKLAERGIVFEKKGSGAILIIQGTAVKASKIGRDISLSKLEERLGPYQASLAEVKEAVSIDPEPIERVEREPKVRNSWERYQEAKKGYFEAKRKAFAELQERQKRERGALQKRQKDERAKIFTRSWKGKGRELNQRRSVMAAGQQTEKLDLRDRLKKERDDLKKLFPLRFPNFKTWLNQEANPELSVLFRYPGDPVMLGASNAADNPQQEDLRAFTAVFGNRGGVGYCRKEKGRGNKPDFVDYGRKILLDKHCDETAVLAALQLASQKWGTVQISGTESYKKLCAEVAAKHGIKISVSGVQTARGKLNPEERRATDIGESRGIFERYANAVGAERFRIVVTDFSQGNGVQAFVFDKKADGLDGKTREGILESMSKLRQYEHYEKNINIVPLSQGKHHILIDDMSVQNLEQLKQDGYRPACVIESSPGNYQAILTIPKLGGSRDHEAANALVRDLNTRYGDPKLSGAIHAHRLPPFMNQKPKHRQEDGTYPATRLAEAEGGICEKASKELTETQKRLAGEAEKTRREQEHRARSASVGSAKTWDTGATDPHGAYRTHWRDVLEKLQGDTDYSRVDAMAGLRMRVTGYSAGQIYEAMKENAPVMRKEAMSEREYEEKYRYRNWDRYAKETVEKYVFGQRGAAQYYKSEEYRMYYMKLEGRNLTGRALTGRSFSEGQKGTRQQESMSILGA